MCPVQAIYMFGHVSRPLFQLIGGEQVTYMYASVLHQNIYITPFAILVIG